SPVPQRLERGRGYRDPPRRRRHPVGSSAGEPVHRRAAGDRTHGCRVSHLGGNKTRVHTRRGGGPLQAQGRTPNFLAMSAGRVSAGSASFNKPPAWSARTTSSEQVWWLRRMSRTGRPVKRYIETPARSRYPKATPTWAFAYAAPRWGTGASNSAPSRARRTC